KIEEASAAVAEAQTNADAASQAVEDFHLRQQKQASKGIRRKCYIVVLSDFYPNDVATTSSFMQNVVLPALHLGGADGPSDEIRRVAMPLGQDSELESNQRRRMCSVAVSELGSVDTTAAISKQFAAGVLGTIVGGGGGGAGTLSRTNLVGTTATNPQVHFETGGLRLVQEDSTMRSDDGARSDTKTH
ncbi:unnamed protein product, partial [Amoebophrya sp. A25]